MKCLLLVVCIIIYVECSGLSIFYPPTLSGEYMSSSLDPIAFDYNVSGRIVHVASACKGLSPQQIQEIESYNEEVIALTLVDVNNFCKYTQIQENLRKVASNIVAILYVNSDGVVGSGQSVARATKAPSSIDSLLPMVDISKHDGLRILAAVDSPVLAVICTPTSNPYYEAIDSNGGIAVRTIIAVWSVALGVFAARNLYRMKCRRGFFKFSLPESAMILEIVVDIIRVLSIVDPGAQKTPVAYVSVLFFLQEFIIQTVLFAVCLYWQKALCKSSMKVENWKMLKKFGIGVFVIWILMLLAVLSILAVNTILAYIVFIIEVLASQVIVIGLIISSLRILKLLKRNPEAKQASKDKLSRIGKLVALSGLTTLFYIIIIIIAATNVTSRNPSQSLLLSSFACIVLLISSTSIVIVFAPSRGTGFSTNMSSDVTTEKQSISSFKSRGIYESEIELGTTV